MESLWPPVMEVTEHSENTAVHLTGEEQTKWNAAAPANLAVH
jgi:hypothetical protein